MPSDSSPYLDVWVSLPGGKLQKLSLPNKDVTVGEIVEGLINENFLDGNCKYRMSHILNRGQKIYDVVKSGINFFVIFEDHGEEDFMPNAPVDKKKIFVVHGHETGLRETVARFLEKLGADVVILEEEPSLGRTIIQKFEDHSDVDYAVVLITGDDRGGTKGATLKQQKPRARQNVIFELGYFLNKLKGGKVCILYENGVELPSDIHGVIYVLYDKSDAWKLPMARELKAAGLDIDTNRLL